ncbi:TRAP transporter small permease [Roseibium marinum]|uniref:TRAP transporter small permease protein n=1 Tax=Roseibium marinum TaxID=281252 RepID=A0A2S3UT51_9HYPH|nr:TRAP transporter small permease subunit [Roseibium marinum]POF30891.1 TRAP-type C4-dicarboxylate transport system permease small subunit [Roseibium marinum]
MLSAINKLADRLIGLSAVLGSIGLIVEVMVILVDVTGRYFGKPLTGAQDISQMTMVIIVFGGMALCDKLGGHISVDIFEYFFPPRVLWLGDVIAPLLGGVIFCGIAWTVWESAALSRMLNLATNIIYLPKAWFQYVVVVLSAITAFGMFTRALGIALSGKPVSHQLDKAI